MTSAIRSRLHGPAEVCIRLVGAPWFSIAGLLNAITLGLETYPPVVAVAGPVLLGIEYACVTAFVVELLVRFGAHLPAPSGRT